MSEFAKKMAKKIDALHTSKKPTNSSTSSSSNTTKSNKASNPIISPSKQKPIPLSKFKPLYKNQANSRTSSTTNSGDKYLNVDSHPESLALKFYVEQLLTTNERKSIMNPKTNRIDHSFWQNSSLLATAIDRLKYRVEHFASQYDKYKGSRDKHKRHWQAESACHYKDKKANIDDWTAPSIDKPHFHFILRDANGNRLSVKTAIKALGLNFWKCDSELLYNDGMTTVAHFDSYSMYLTHDTDKAKADGKEHYDISEVMTNMSPKELRDVRAGVGSKLPDEISRSQWNELGTQADELGDNLDDLNKIKDRLSFVNRHCKHFNDLANEYEEHLKVACDNNSRANKGLTRCSILIYGNGNLGKTYAAYHAVRDILKKQVYKARSGTGKYDGIFYGVNALLYDDTSIKNALGACDNYPIVLHCRGTGNDKPWLGEYAIVSTNYTPNEFFEKQASDDEHKAPLRSRFYVCHFIGRRLVVDSFADASYRGKCTDVTKRNKLFMQFVDAFNKLSAQYKPLTVATAPKLPGRYYAQYYAPHNEYDLMTSITLNGYSISEQQLLTEQKDNPSANFSPNGDCRLENSIAQFHDEVDYKNVPVTRAHYFTPDDLRKRYQANDLIYFNKSNKPSLTFHDFMLQLETGYYDNLFTSFNHLGLYKFRVVPADGY